MTRIYFVTTEVAKFEPKKSITKFSTTVSGKLSISLQLTDKLKIIKKY